MIKIACLKCHWSWSLNHDAIRQAITSMDSVDSHFSVECPRCRRVNKIPRRQLEQAIKLMGLTESTAPATSRSPRDRPAKDIPATTKKPVDKPSAKSGTSKKPTTKKAS